MDDNTKDVTLSILWVAGFLAMLAIIGSCSLKEGELQLKRQELSQQATNK